MGNVLIQISSELWDVLNKMKEHGESFNDVLYRLLKKELNKEIKK